MRKWVDLLVLYFRILFTVGNVDRVSTEYRPTVDRYIDRYIDRYLGRHYPQ